MTINNSTTLQATHNTLTLRDAAVLSATHTVMAAADSPQIVDSTALLQGQRAVGISHNGAVYRLQSTKLGKLILTK